MSHPCQARALCQWSTTSLTDLGSIDAAVARSVCRQVAVRQQDVWCACTLGHCNHLGR